LLGRLPFVATSQVEVPGGAVGNRDGIAAKPLFRDPIYDGAADPTVIWNRTE